MKPRFFIGALAVALSATAAAAPPDKNTQDAIGYLGHTSSSLTGESGLSGFYAACQSEYGDGAVMCTTKQLFDDPSIAGQVIDAAGMWVRPFPVGGGQDYSGYFANATVRWCSTNNSAQSGLYVGSNWGVGLLPCNYAIPVACCR